MSADDPVPKMHAPQISRFIVDARRVPLLPVKSVAPLKGRYSQGIQGEVDSVVDEQKGTLHATLSIRTVAPKVTDVVR